MVSQYDRWLDRAEEFERLLVEEGPRAAGAFVKRYRHKLALLLDAIWELFVIRQESEQGEGE